MNRKELLDDIENQAAMDAALQKTAREFVRQDLVPVANVMTNLQMDISTLEAMIYSYNIDKDTDIDPYLVWEAAMDIVFPDDLGIEPNREYAIIAMKLIDPVSSWLRKQGENSKEESQFYEDIRMSVQGYRKTLKNISEGKNPFDALHDQI